MLTFTANPVLEKPEGLPLASARIVAFRLVKLIVGASLAPSDLPCTPLPVGKKVENNSLGANPPICL